MLETSRLIISKFCFQRLKMFGSQPLVGIIYGLENLIDFGTVGRCSVPRTKHFFGVGVAIVAECLEGQKNMVQYIPRFSR